MLTCGTACSTVAHGPPRRMARASAPSSINALESSKATLVHWALHSVLVLHVPKWKVQKAYRIAHICNVQLLLMVCSWQRLVERQYKYSSATAYLPHVCSWQAMWNLTTCDTSCQEIQNRDFQDYVVGLDCSHTSHENILATNIATRIQRFRDL